MQVPTFSADRASNVELIANTQKYSAVAQDSKPAVAQVSKPAGRTLFDVQPTGKSATRQVWKPALQARCQHRVLEFGQAVLSEI